MHIDKLKENIMDKHDTGHKFSALEIGIVAVVAITAVVLGIIFLAPSSQKIETRNTTREEDVQEILNGVKAFSIDNSGGMPSEIPLGDKCDDTNQEICKTGAADCSDYIELSSLTDDEQYLDAIPTDPNGTSDNGSGYYIMQNNVGRVTVCAPHSEDGVGISVTQ